MSELERVGEKSKRFQRRKKCRRVSKAGGVLEFKWVDLRARKEYFCC